MSRGDVDWTKLGALATIAAIPIAGLYLILENPLKCWAGTGGEWCPPVEEIVDHQFPPVESLPPASLPPRPSTRFTLRSGHTPEGVHGAVQALLESGKRITSVSFAPGGGWLVVWEGSQYRAHGLSPHIRSVLDSLVHARSPIADVVFAPWSGTDTWAIIHGNGEVVGNEIPPGAADALDQARRAGTPVSSVAFLGMGAWFVIHPDRAESGGPMPEPLSQVVRTALQRRIPRTLRLLDAGGYLMQYDENSWTASGLPGRAPEELERLRREGKRVRVTSFTPEGGWLVVAEAA
jgi:hypothetical protein